MLLLLAVSATQAADPVEAWHTVDPSARFGSVQLTAHTQFRWRAHTPVNTGEMPRVAYFRAGPMAQIALPGVTLHAGYWYQDAHRNSADWEDSQRVFAGAERDLVRGVRTRGLWEYFFAASRPSFHRYRHLLRFGKESDGWSPLGSCEVFFDARGAAALRPLASLRHNVGTRARVELGYFFDWRRGDVGGPRHVLFTTLRLQLRQ
ncbi:MAG: DUF2490 domain-containing protein [Bryobacterales bacterium]|nr:DUF2490 domain-containing protein [Bryobacterales bacterium]